MYSPRLSRASLAGLVLALGLSLPAHAAAQATNGGRVLGIHHVTLKPAIDVKAFEACIAKQNAAFKDVLPGLQLYIMKGDRGEQAGQYIVVYELDSTARRAEYWPAVGGGPSPKAQEALSKVPDMKCGDYMDGNAPDRYTDFVVIS